MLFITPVTLKKAQVSVHMNTCVSLLWPVTLMCHLSQTFFSISFLPSLLHEEIEWENDKDTRTHTHTNIILNVERNVKA